MKKWHIPAKTFLLGEYAALIGESALLITTEPFFTLTYNEEFSSDPCIHKNSPAGRFSLANNLALEALHWEDPYEGIGGLGASSAQFIGCYLIYCEQNNLKPNHHDLLTAYFQYAWNGKGLKPSGYDILAQIQNECVYINKSHNQLQKVSWDFDDIALVLVHTGNKIATHTYLESSKLPNNLPALSNFATQAKNAMIQKDSQRFIDIINSTHKTLKNENLVDQSSVEWIEDFKKDTNFLAAKGCGALGADVILLIVEDKNLSDSIKKIKNENFKIVATNKNIFNNKNT